MSQTNALRRQGRLPAAGAQILRNLLILRVLDEETGTGGRRQGSRAEDSRCRAALVFCSQAGW